MKLHRITKACAWVAVATVALTGCSSQKSKKDKASTAAPVQSNQPIAPPIAQAPAGATVVWASLAGPRADHSATLVAQGVVVLGGETARGQVTAAAELYRNGAWAPAGALAVARKGHSATLLSSGKVLVVGGQADAQGRQVLDSIELYDPVAQRSTAGPKLTAARTGHVAVAFRTPANEEIVLIAGGAGASGSLSSAELYHVASNRITPLPSPMVTDRVGAQGQLLSNGQVLLQGGYTGFSQAALQLSVAGAELFDPVSRTFSAVAPLGIDRYGAGLALVDGGQAVVVGGESAVRPEASIEVFDPRSKSFQTSSAALSVARDGLSLSLLRSGDLLAAGGSEAAGPSAAVDRFESKPDAANGRVTALLALREARRDHTATVLPNGNVLVVGGFGAAGALATSEEYDAYAAPGTKPASKPAAPATPVNTTPPATQPAQPPAQPAPAPDVLAILPTKGKPGDLITIAGRNFAAKRQDNEVIFTGNVTGRVHFDVSIKNLPFLGRVQTLIVEVPHGAQTGPVVVRCNNQTSGPRNFTIDMQSGGTPQVLYTLPRKARTGGIVSIFGRNFANPATDNVVKFSGVAANTMGGLTTQSVPFLGNLSVMVVTVPPGAVTGSLTVEAYGKTSNGYSFQVEGTTPNSGSTSTGTSTSSGSTSTGGSTSTVTFFAEDFEGNTLRVSQQGGLWEASRPSNGPGRAASGDWCAGTAMGNGAYPAQARGYLITPEIDLTQATTAELRFNHFVDTDGVDAGRILISRDGGTTYYLVRPAQGYVQTAVFNPGEGFTGQSGAWQTVTCDLSAFAGERVVVVFDFASDTIDQRSGWFVDDIEVRGY